MLLGQRKSMLPVKLFCRKDNHSRIARSENVLGTEPVSSLLPSSRSRRSLHLPRPSGIGPVSRLECAEKASNSNKSSNEAGSVPVRRFSSNESPWSNDRLPMLPGIVPVISLPPSANAASSGKLKSSGGRVPESFISQNPRDSSLSKSPITSGSAPCISFSASRRERAWVKLSKGGKDPVSRLSKRLSVVRRGISRNNDVGMVPVNLLASATNQRRSLRLARESGMVDESLFDPTPKCLRLVIFPRKEGKWPVI
mmetsp:Transcript_5210/g.9044  ORF Transcript_5210/g.9044 Transcript_5210/m.9044 type:complete len:254 (-) Transcript_5210:46-807(-)